MGEEAMAVSLDAGRGGDGTDPLGLQGETGQRCHPQTVRKIELGS